MALIIEDGSGVASANSYATVDEAKAYAAARGLTLPTPDSAVEPLLVKAADYIGGLESRFKGTRTEADQALAWPRADVFLFGSATAIDSDSIPDQLKKAQCQLAVDAVTQNLQPNGTGQEAIRKKVDVIETEFAKSGVASLAPKFTAAMNLLAPLLINSGQVSTLRV